MQEVMGTADERSPVIVFTCGRSGSTLLARMLNCLPQTIVWGEHGAALSPLLKSYSSARKVAESRLVTESTRYLQPVLQRQPILRNSGMSIEWLNWFTANDIATLYQQLVSDLFYPEMVRDRFARWGFKEIRYREVEYDLLRQLFPDMKAIILHRSPVAVCASQFKHFGKENTKIVPYILNRLESFYRFAAQVAECQSEAEHRTLFISYEEINFDFENSVSALQTFLDEEMLPGVAEIGAEVKAYNRRRPVQPASDRCFEDLLAWKATVGADVPDSKLGVISQHYQRLTELTAQDPEPLAAVDAYGGGGA